MVGGHACQMSKPLNSLLLYAVVGWCCSDHFPDVLVSYHVSFGLVDSSSLTSHLAGGDLSFKAFGQGPCLALVCQGGDEDGVDELSFGFDGDVGVFQERCKLVADIVCFLDSCFDFSVKSSIFCKYAAEVLELSHLWS